MRDMAEAEQARAQRLRAEFRETAERTREAQEVEKKLSDFEVQKLAAFERCASCTTCEWSRQGSKGCKECLGQFYRTHRLTRIALEYQCEVVTTSGGATGPGLDRNA